MKKKLLYIITVVTSICISAQVLEQNDFESLAWGNLNGQGGYTTSGATDYFKVVKIDDEHNKSVQITGPQFATQRFSSFFMTNGLKNNWNNRIVGNDAIRFSGEFHTGTSQFITGAGDFGSLIEDESYQEIIGLSYQFGTKKLQGFVRVKRDGVFSRFTIDLGTQKYETKTWIPVSYAYNYNTGEAFFTTPEGNYTIKSGNFNGYEIEVIPQQKPMFLEFRSAANGGNTLNHINSYDNYNVEAIKPIILSTSENKYKSNISIYPNPSQDFVNIYSKEIVLSVKIIDESARLIKEIKSGNKIDVRSIENGIYYLEIKTDNDFQILKFIKK
jgi:hypothetical protein